MNNELRIISEKLVERLDEILDKFGIKANKFSNRYSFSCPIHNGDNPGSLNIFISGSKIIGNWKCWTHGCQNTYGMGILGFIRGILSQNGKQVSFGETVGWARKFLGNIDIEEPSEIGYNDFLNIIDNFNKNEIGQTGSQSKEEFRKKIIIPPEFYINRGYHKTTLNKFDVGLCLDKTDRFFSRVVVPVYNDDGDIVIASIARTTQPKCVICNKYHFENRKCPQNKLEEIWAQKWLNSTGFKKSNSLYNYWNAKKYIGNIGTLILVEGPGDVWRLDEAGIYNSVALYGCDLHETQRIILEKSGVMNLIIALDNDDAGKKGKEDIIKYCSRMYNLRFIELEAKDIGETSIEKIKELFK